MFLENTEEMSWFYAFPPTHSAVEFVPSEAPTAEHMKSNVFCEVTPHSLAVH
jgi:hypothetical protein